jgi:hypothetical protein
LDKLLTEKWRSRKPGLKSATNIYPVTVPALAYVRLRSATWSKCFDRRRQGDIGYVQLRHDFA